jgi:hypothetical protein
VSSPFTGFVEKRLSKIAALDVGDEGAFFSELADDQDGDSIALPRMVMPWERWATTPAGGSL